MGHYGTLYRYLAASLRRSKQFSSETIGVFWRVRNPSLRKTDSGDPSLGDRPNPVQQSERTAVTSSCITVRRYKSCSKIVSMGVEEVFSHLFGFDIPWTAIITRNAPPPSYSPLALAFCVFAWIIAMNKFLSSYLTQRRDGRVGDFVKSNLVTVVGHSTGSLPCFSISSGISFLLILFKCIWFGRGCMPDGRRERKQTLGAQRGLQLGMLTLVLAGIVGCSPTPTERLRSPAMNELPIQFGDSLAIHSNWSLIGSPAYSSVGAGRGGAFFFQLNQTSNSYNWDIINLLKLPMPQIMTNSGQR